MDAAGLERAGVGSAELVAALVGLGVAGAVLLVVGAVTARRPAAPLPNLDSHLQRWSEVHAGIDPGRSRWVRGWLRLMHLLARPLAARGVSPDLLTWSGWWWAAAAATAMAAGGRWPLLAAVLVAAGGVADGLDGAVAVLTRRASAWGGLLDSLVDRLADWTLLLGLAALGAGVVAPVAAGAALSLLEYARSRSGVLGADLDVVTVGERPTRIVLVGLSAWCAGLLPEAAAGIALTGAAGVAVVSLVGLFHLSAAARRVLR